MDATIKEFEQNIATLLALQPKPQFNKTTKYSVAKINDQTIYLTEFLFAKQRGLIHNLQGHTDIAIEYYKLLPYIFNNIQEIHYDSKSTRKAYIIDDIAGKKIYHIIDEEGFLLTIYVVREKEHKRFLKKAKEVIKTEPDGEAPGSPILSPAWAAFWRHPDLIEQLYHIFRNHALRPIYLFSISSHPQAIHIDPLSITFFKPDIDFSSCDYLILTSKQAVKALLQYPKEEYIDKKALCISKATAKAYEELGAEVLEIGQGYGDSLIDAIKKHPKSLRWLYLRAEVIASDFSTYLRQNGYNIEEAVVYKSECSQKILEANVSENAILIFTSPSAIRCYLKTHSILPSQKVIAIGKTSAKTLPKGVDFIIPADTSVQSCIEIARNLRT